jgi:hypothetical protein
MFMMWQRFITCKSPALLRASSSSSLLLCPRSFSYPSFSFLNSTPPPYSNKTHTMAPTTFKLNTGQEIPAVGLGAFLLLVSSLCSSIG